MKTKNDFHRTPKEIQEFINQFIPEDASILDICSGDGALTSMLPNTNVTNIEIDKNFISKHKTLNVDFLKMDWLDIPHTDVILMNPPFTNYSQFMDKLIDHLVEIGKSDILCYVILPKRAVDEYVNEWACFEFIQKFNQVDFGTTITDIVVCKVSTNVGRNSSGINTDKKIIHPITDNVNVSTFLNVLNTHFGISIQRTYEGIFLRDSYTYPQEDVTYEDKETHNDIFKYKEYRTDFVYDHDIYTFSTFHSNVPTIKDVLESAINYVNMWIEHFGNNSLDNTSEFLDMDGAESYYKELYYGKELTFETISHTAYRTYKDSKVMEILFKNYHFHNHWDLLMEITENF